MAVAERFRRLLAAGAGCCRARRRGRRGRAGRAARCRRRPRRGPAAGARAAAPPAGGPPAPRVAIGSEARRIGAGRPQRDAGRLLELAEVGLVVVAHVGVGQRVGDEGGEAVDGDAVVGVAACRRRATRSRPHVVEVDGVAGPHQHPRAGRRLVLVEEADGHDPQGVGAGGAGAEGDAGRAGAQRQQLQRVVDRALGEDADGAVDGELGVAGGERLGVVARVRAVLAAVHGQHAGQAEERADGRAPSTASTWRGSARAGARWRRAAPDRRTRWRGWRRSGSGRSGGDLVHALGLDRAEPGLGDRAAPAVCTDAGRPSCAAWTRSVAIGARRRTWPAALSMHEPDAEGVARVGEVLAGVAAPALLAHLGRGQQGVGHGDEVDAARTAAGDMRVAGGAGAHGVDGAAGLVERVAERSTPAQRVIVRCSGGPQRGGVAVGRRRRRRVAGC